jgi:hypothetical protein
MLRLGGAASPCELPPLLLSCLFYVAGAARDGALAAASFALLWFCFLVGSARKGAWAVLAAHTIRWSAGWKGLTNIAAFDRCGKSWETLLYFIEIMVTAL